jgi:hypothetical protein
VLVGLVPVVMGVKVVFDLLAVGVLVAVSVAMGQTKG